MCIAPLQEATLLAKERELREKLRLERDKVSQSRLDLRYLPTCVCDANCALLTVAIAPSASPQYTAVICSCKWTMLTSYEVFVTVLNPSAGD